MEKALDNNRSCPICGAGIVLAGADAIQGEIYGHDCECSLEIAMLEGELYVVNSREYGTDDYGPYEDDRNYCVYEDDEICIFDDGQLIQKTFYPDNTIRRKHTHISPCHACKKKDGVNSEVERCEEDPPYAFKCKYCQQSLRTHEEYGVGREFDMAKKGITWHFVGKKPQLIGKPICLIDDGIPF